MNQNRKKIIILAHDFEPVNTISAQRSNACSKYFAQFGFQVVVFCIGNENKHVIKENIEVFYNTKKSNIRDSILLKYGDSKFVFFRKMLSFLYQFFQFHSKIFDINHSIFESCSEYLKHHEADYIIASGEPFILFKYAAELSKKHQIKWCADYRDDWIEDHGMRYSGFLNRFTIKRQQSIEKKLISGASHITTVSKHLKKQIADRTKHQKVEVIENGIDEEMYQDALKTAVLNHNSFTLCYTGRLYNSHYIQMFSEGFEKFMQEIQFRENVKVYFYGIEIQYNKAVEDVYLLKKKFPDNFFIMPQVSQKEAIAKQIEANVLLNFIPGDVSKGIIGAKTYSYAYTRNFILTIPDVPNKNTEFFPESNAQFIAINSDEVFQALINQYTLFQANKRFVSNLSDSDLQTLTRKFQIEKWKRLLF